MLILLEHWRFLPQLVPQVAVDRQVEAAVGGTETLAHGDRETLANVYAQFDMQPVSGDGGSRDLREWRAVPRSWVSTYSQVRGCSLWKREIQHGCHLVQPAYVGSAGTGAHVEARGGCQESHAHILCLSPGDTVPLILELG